VTYRFDDTTGDFTVSFDNVPDLQPAITLAFPADRHYPGGFDIGCTDAKGRWSFTHDPAAVEIRATFDAASSGHTLTLRRR